MTMDPEIIRRIREWKDGKKPGPYGIELSPSLRCNENCLFCWRRGVEKVDCLDELPLEKYAEIISDAAEMGVREFKIIGGGEATIRPETFEMMRLIKEKGMSGYLCTNGTMFTEERTEQIVKSGWDHIKISFHGKDSVTHDELAGLKGAYDKVIAAARLFRKYKERYRSELPRLEFGFVMVNKNFRQIPGMVALAHELGVDAVFIEPITVYSELGESLRLDEKERRELVEISMNAEKEAKKHGISTNLGQFTKDTLVKSTNQMDKIILEDDKKESGFNGMPCFEPFYRMGIRTDGLVGPCGFLDDTSTENARDKRLKEVWLGGYMQRMRESMMTRKLGGQCSRCCTTLVFNNAEIRRELGRRQQDGRQ